MQWRQLKGPIRYVPVVLTALGLGLCLIYVFNILIVGQVLPLRPYVTLLSAILLPALFLWLPATRTSPRDRVPWYDYLLATISIFPGLFSAINVNTMLLEGWVIRPPTITLVLGAVIVVLSVDATRRAVGNLLTGMVVVIGAYPLFSQYLGGFFWGTSPSLDKYLAYLFMSESGIYGILMSVFGRLLIGFMAFGILLEVVGGTKGFIDLSFALLGHVRGGVAKVCVLSSMMMASVSGSAVSNVITTGVFTIPAMKRTGYPPEVAGAVEACASTGGVIMPPVMAAAAFVMASFLGVPYAEVAMAALLPALLYYISLYFQLDFYAAYHGLKGMPRKELPSATKALGNCWMFGAALVILIWFLFLARVEAMAPFYAMAFLFACLVVKSLRRGIRSGLIAISKSLFEFTEKTGKVIVNLLGINIALGIILGAIAISGKGLAFGNVMVQLGHGNVFALAAVGLLASYILGIGLTTTPCYVILAVLVAPALVASGTPYPIQAHMFVLIAGTLSNIIPPVAMAAIAAGSIAGADPMKVAMKAVRLGSVLMIYPFFVIINPSLIIVGSITMETVLAFMKAVLAVAVLASGLERYAPGLGKMGIPSSILVVASGLCLFFPGVQLPLVGVGIALVAYVSTWSVIRRKKKAYQRAELLGGGTNAP